MKKEMMIALVRYEMVTATFLDPINKDPDLLDVHGPLLTESGQPDLSLSLSQPASHSSTNYLTKGHYWGVDSKHLLDFLKKNNIKNKGNQGSQQGEENS